MADMGGVCCRKVATGRFNLQAKERAVEVLGAVDIVGRDLEVPDIVGHGEVWTEGCVEVFGKSNTQRYETGEDRRSSTVMPETPDTKMPLKGH